MTLETARLRAYVAHEIGCRLEDSLESAKAEVTRWEGASSGLREGAKAIEALLAHVDKDIDEGKYDLPTGAAIKLYINRASQVCTNLSVQATTHKAMASGSVSMGEANVKVIKKFHEEELRKATAIAAAEAESRAAGKPAGEEESESIRSRPVGVHPPVSLKQQRLAEEAAEAAKAAPAVPTTVVVAAPVAVAPVAVAVPIETPPPEEAKGPTWTLEELGGLLQGEQTPVPPAPPPAPTPVPPTPIRPVRARRPVPRVTPAAAPPPVAPPVLVSPPPTPAPTRKKPGPKPGSKRKTKI